MKSKNPRHNSVRIVRRDYCYSGTCQCQCSALEDITSVYQCKNYILFFKNMLFGNWNQVLQILSGHSHAQIESSLLMECVQVFLNLQRLVWTPKLKFLFFICARLRSGSFVTFYTIINVVRRTHITVSIRVFLKQGELHCTSSIFYENLICWWDIWLWWN